MYVIGINHKKADTKTREQFVLSEKEQTEFFNRLKKEMPGAGCVMLMTCNRSELYLSGGELTFSKIEQLFTEVKQLPASLVKAVLLRYEGEAAIHHLFHVVCGLESAVLGEVEIIRQVKEAYQSSVGQQMVDASLHLIFQHALKLAKEMATNSRMTHLPVSVGTLATLAVSDFVKEKQEPHVLLLGATGQMGSIVRKDLLSLKLPMHLIATTRSHAGVLAVRDDLEERITWVPYEERRSLFDWADVLISATKSPHYTVLAQDMKTCRKRKDKLLCIDLAVPRDIDDEVAELPGITLLNMDDIKQLSRHNNREKEAEAGKMEDVIQKEVDEIRKTLLLREFFEQEEVRAHANDPSFQILYRFKKTLDYEAFQSVLDDMKEEHIWRISRL